MQEVVRRLPNLRGWKPHKISDVRRFYTAVAVLLVWPTVRSVLFTSGIIFSSAYSSSISYDRLNDILLGVNFNSDLGRGE